MQAAKTFYFYHTNITRGKWLEARVVAKGGELYIVTLSQFQDRFAPVAIYDIAVQDYINFLAHCSFLSLCGSGKFYRLEFTFGITHAALAAIGLAYIMDLFPLAVDAIDWAVFGAYRAARAFVGNDFISQQ